MYTYSVNDLGLKKFYCYMDFTGILQFYALKIAFCVQCYSVLYVPTAYYSGNGVHSYTSLN